MKGQYLAIQAVLASVIGVLILLGSILLFEQVDDLMEGESEQQDLHYIENKVSTTVYSLETATTGEVQLELPEEIGGSEYSFDTDGDTLIVQWEDSRSNITFSELSEQYDFEGDPSGGNIEVVKTESTYTFR